MFSKNEKRLEAKKRKAEAFLNLVKEEAKAGASEASEDGIKEKKSKTAPSAEEMITAYKKELKSRQNASMQRPKLFLTLDELTRDHPVDSGTDEIKQLPPLFITDVQYLLLYCLQGVHASIKPRWCRLLRVGKVDKVVTVVLDSLSADDLSQYADSLPTLKSAFDISVKMVTPAQYGSTVREDLLNVPMSITQMKKINYKAGKRRAKALQKKYDQDMSPKKIKTEAPDTNENVESSSASNYPEAKTTHEQDVFDRTCLLLNAQQMMYEGYPLPVCDKYMNNTKGGFVFSKDTYKKTSSASPLFSVDCEMVQTTERRNELARVSVINENLECVYDTFVKPRNKIIDYLTKYSGITKKIMDPVTTRLEDVQRHIREILPPDAILCGQSLNGDLNSLKMYHPYVIDTSVIYNLTGNRRMKTGLKRLTEHFLRRNIQNSPLGHNSVEDAVATMELVLLKLKNGLAFGDLIMAGPEALIAGNHDHLQTLDKSGNNLVEENHKTIQNNTLQETVTESKNDSVLHNSQECDPKLPVTENKNDSVLENSSECDLKPPLANPLSNSMGESGSDSECGELTQKEKDQTLVLNSERNTSASETEKRRTFFQKDGSKYVQSFFEVIKKQEKTGKITDSEECTSLYSDKDLIQTSDSDKGKQLLVNSSVGEADFNIVHLYGFSQFFLKNKGQKETDDEVKKKCLWKLDRRLWKILKSVPPKSMFVVILSGRLEGKSILPAMTLAKVT